MNLRCDVCTAVRSPPSAIWRSVDANVVSEKDAVTIFKAEFTMKRSGRILGWRSGLTPSDKCRTHGRDGEGESA